MSEDVVTCLRAGALLDEGAAPQRPEPVGWIGAKQVAERALREGVPEDGRVLERALLLGGQLIDPRSDRGLHRVRKRPDPRVRAALADPARDLLGEERVASRGGGDPR